MAWSIEYYAQADATQPAEIFEDALDRAHPKLAGKLARIAVEVQTQGYRLGGGLIERCRGYAGLWEMRAIHNQWLAREFFGFDETRVVLLHGYVKRGGQPAPRRELASAFDYWSDYQRSHRISLAQEGEGEPL